jgi:hypothetical protein
VLGRGSTDLIELITVSPTSRIGETFLPLLDDCLREVLEEALNFLREVGRALFADFDLAFDFDFDFT